MNRERAKELLPIIQAFAEGKAIQASSKFSDERVDLSSPTWDEGSIYRIKPEKKVGYLNIYGGNPQSGYLHSSRKEADEARNGSVESRIACIRIEYTEGEFHD